MSIDPPTTAAERPVRDPLRGQHRGSVLFVMLLAFAAYGPSLDDYFVKDDLSLRIIADAEGRFDARSWWSQLIVPTERNYDDIWRPVPALTWAVDYLVFGPDPTAFHLGNVLLHALNTVLVYWLFSRWLRFRAPGAALIAAAGFAVYPIGPEAVLWSTQRTVVMGLFFSLLAMVQFDLFLHRRRRLHLVLAFLWMALGLLSREHAAALPAVFATQALLFGPRRPLPVRFSEVLRIGVVGVLLLTAYFGARALIFEGRDGFLNRGGYAGWPTMEAYSADNRVFERLPTTLRLAFAPANADYLGRPQLDAPFRPGSLFLAFQVLVVGLALARGLGTARRDALRILLVTGVFTATAWYPVLRVLYIEENLLNSRSGYHLLALFAAAVPALLLLPGRAAREGRFRFLPPLAVLLLLVWTVVLQVNLRAYDGGGRQVRGIQTEVVRVARDHPGALVGVLDLPSEYHGCPTIDAYLPWLLRPPFTEEEIPAGGLVRGRPPMWARELLLHPTASIRALRKVRGGVREIAWCVARDDPARLEPLFGAPEPAHGVAPPRPVFPPDTEAFVLVPGDHLLGEGRLANPLLPARPADTFLPDASGELALVSLEAPLFAFAAAPEDRRFRIEIRVPDARYTWTLERGRNLAELGDRLIWKLTDGGVGSDDPPAVSWPAPPLTAFPRHLPIQWRVASLDAEDRVVALSASRRMLVIDTRLP